MSGRENCSTEKDTYFTDPESAAEMARLIKQARLLTRAMGGLLDESIDPTRLFDILDLACGPGEWVLEMAATYPAKQVVGVDLSQLMIDYSRFQASQRDLANAHFSVMNILQPLDFSDHTFDFVNIRLIASFMFRSTDNWPKLLQECRRVLRPGGLLRITDCEWFISNSPMTEQLFGLCTRAVHLSGNSFSPDGRHLALTPMLKRLFRNAGFDNIQQKAFVVDCSAGSESHQSFYEDMAVFLKLLQPLLVQTGVATQEVCDTLYYQTLEEINAEDFNCLWYYLSVWGENNYLAVSTPSS